MMLAVEMNATRDITTLDPCGLGQKSVECAAK
jgi:hypothetical protein